MAATDQERAAREAVLQQAKADVAPVPFDAGRPLDGPRLCAHHLRMTVRTHRAPTNLTLPVDLVAQVDAIAGARGRSRFIEEATRAAIRREKLRVMHASVAGALKVEDYPQWATSADVVAWVRGSRAEERLPTDPASDPVQR